MTQRRYLPAASIDFLLPAYDPIMRLLGYTRALRPLLEQAQLEPHHVVLDIGCGTGTLALMIKRAHPGIEVTGIDPDPRALARAARKIRRAGVAVRLDRAFADDLPFPDGAFDRVFSSMMFHHIPRREKPAVLAEVRRVLKGSGRLELLDFAGGTHNALAQVLHGRTASDSANARFLQAVTDAGFNSVRRIATRSTIAGAIAYYQACA